MKKIILPIAAVVVIAAAYGLYMFYKKPVDTRTADAEFILTANELVGAFDTDEDAANKKFLDQIIQVKGMVAEITIDSSGTTIVLDSDDPVSGVTCSFYTEETGSLSAVKVGDSINIKGKCTGKLIDVVLNNCSIVNEP
jgi:tRNA_anti-like